MEEQKRQKPTKLHLTFAQNTNVQVKRKTKVHKLFQIKTKLRNQYSENNIKVLSSLVPDEIIYNTSNNEEITHTGTVLCADVSGFTDLTEKYNSIGKGGPSRLTNVLNDYIGALVQEIMLHNGDVLKFSGDAFLAMWKSSELVSLSEIVQATIDCALNIQKTHGSYKTEIGVTLRVKIAISAGSITFSIIGDSNFLTVGNTILDVKSSGHLCDPGDIIISPSVWFYVNSGNYLIEKLKDGTHMRILGIGKEWSPLQHHNQNESFHKFHARKDSEVNFSPERQSQVNFTYGPVQVDVEDNEEDVDYYEDFSLRPSLDYACSHNMINYLRKFIIAPVIRVIDENEPLEYLTEMRQVVIAFINIVLPKISISQVVKTADAAYRLICQLATTYNGIVNKISMFDKDLMFLVIFGLRGFKHNMETQMALHYSLQIRAEILKLLNIKSISIGVTSGKTYCGVVGHPLRREYTVIGRSVNKAARLMVAYPNKVTCDRTTFMQSKLKTEYFLLEKTKVLKGFSNIEPIYEFLGAEMDSTSDLCTRNMLPILGRQQEVQIYLDNLNKYLQSSKYDVRTKTMFIITGIPQIGKTRLLKECIRLTPDSIDIIKCVLDPKDRQIPYHTLQLILYLTCDIYFDDTVIERTEIIAQKLRSIIVPSLLCSLNTSLNVAFPITPDYEMLDEAKRDIAEKKMIGYLIKKCFKESTIIAIDNLEYADQQSCELLPLFIESGCVFLIAAFVTGNKLTPAYMDIFNHEKSTSIRLEGLGKLHHRNMACQFLNVTCLPLELDRYITIYSNGVPGWIENFLTTLTQCKGIIMHNATRTYIYKQGYCLLHNDWLEKSEPDKSLESLMNLANEIESFQIMEDKWYMYSDAYTSSEINLSLAQNKEDVPRTHLVCSIAQDFNLDDMEREDTLDIKMMKMYDALTIQEQQLLKCCTVLGDIFSRTMLYYIMPVKSENILCYGIRKFFEIQVLICARGKYENGYIHIEHSTQNPYEIEEIECHCKGFPQIDFEEDLPKYAKCCIMKFREPKFRMMVHNLLTDNQIKQLHTKAIWYLEHETKRCQSCGGGYFVYLNGCNYDDGIEIPRYEEKPFLVEEEAMLYGLSFETLISQESREDEKIDKGKIDSPHCMSKSTIDRHPFSFTTRKISEILTVKIRSFYDVNLKKCECPLILTNVYTRMLYHCQEIDMDEKRLHVLLEYATLSIRNYNFYIAIDLLQSATDLLKKKLQVLFKEPDWQMPLMNSRICTIKGILNLKRYAYEESELYLNRALIELGIRIPTTKPALNFLLKREYWRQKLIFKFPNTYLAVLDEDKNILAEQMATTLTACYTLYKKTNRNLPGYLVALWALNEALKSHTNFSTICRAYENIIDIKQFFDINTEKFEKLALRFCFLKITRLDSHEMEIVMSLYGHIFLSRFFRSDPFYDVTHMANILFNMNLRSNIKFFQWSFLPMIARMYIMAKKVQSVFKLLEEYKHLENDAANTDALVYYVICIDVKIDLGYETAPFHKIEELFFSMVHIMTENTELINKLGSAIGLLHTRNENWEAFENITSTLTKHGWPNMQHKFHSLDLVRIIEAYLIILVRDINIRDFQGISESMNKVNKFFKMLFKMLKYAKNIIPRYWHLMAWYNKILDNDKKAMIYLQRALNYANNENSALEKDWIEHTLKYWNNELTEEQINKWYTVDSGEVLKNWKDINEDSPLPLMTLKIPNKTRAPQ